MRNAREQINPHHAGTPIDAFFPAALGCDFSAQGGKFPSQAGFRADGARDRSGNGAGGPARPLPAGAWRCSRLSDPEEEGQPGMAHSFALRVYYEDTDLAGIVYYANYLKFIERARSEWVRERGIDQTRLKAEDGIVFAVRRVEADYLRPAHFDDLLRVETELTGMTGARIALAQTVLRGAERLFVASVTLVCMTGVGMPTRLPEAVRARLAASR